MRSVLFIYCGDTDAARAAHPLRSWRRRGGRVRAGPSADALDDAIADCDAAAVLIGARTAESAAVRSGISRCLVAGLPLFGVRIHGLAGADGRPQPAGPSPLDLFALSRLRPDAALACREWRRGGWMPAAFAAIPPVSPYRGVRSWAKLSTLVPTYDWVAHKGSANLASWVELAYWRGRA